MRTEGNKEVDCKFTNLFLLLSLVLHRNMKKILLLFILLYLSFASSSASPYTLDLPAEDWHLNLKDYYISEIRDERPQQDLGKVMVDGKIVPATFKVSLSSDLLNLINSGVQSDTNSIPVILVVKKFRLNETGTLARHKATLQFSVEFKREISGESYPLFSLSGIPEVTMTGNSKLGHEKNIKATIKLAVTNFNDWIQKNMNIPPMVKRAEIVFSENIHFKKDEGDTLLWSDNYQLQWSDFQGKPKNSDFAAESNCSFLFYSSQEVKDNVMYLNIQANACFAKSSWVKPDLKRDSLLLHEQYHFNICEQYIRLLKSKLKLLDLEPIKNEKQVRAVFDEVWAEYKQAQDDYDNRTEHGLINSEQSRWMREVDEALKK